MSRYPFYKQHDASDCGAACLRMVAAAHQSVLSANFVREKTQIVKDGISLNELSEASQKLGFETLPLKIDFTRLKSGVPMPFIAFWRGNHFVVVYQIEEKFVIIADPAVGISKISTQNFLQNWQVERGEKGENLGYALILQATSKLFENKETGVAVVKNTFGSSALKYLGGYLKGYKNYFYQIGVGILVITLINSFLPFLVRSVVDAGISRSNYSFLFLLLIAQIVLLFFSNALEFVRSVLFIQVAARLNLTHTSDILRRILNLPLTYFETKKEEDIVQRVNDAQRLEQFFSAQSAQYIFAAYTLFVLNAVLCFFHPILFLISVVFLAIYAALMYFFQKEKQQINAIRNLSLAENQAVLNDFVQGLRDIKIFGAEDRMIHHWERLRSELFHKSFAKALREQWQRFGGRLINDIKNAVIIYFSARYVISNEITVGSLMAIIFVLGLMYAPIDNLAFLVSSSRATQRALVRLYDVHKNEFVAVSSSENSILPENPRDICINNLSFIYPNSAEPKVKNITTRFKLGESTAIVGASGSGKTTILKLLTHIYQPTNGEILFGDMPLENISTSEWFNQCRSIFNDSYIFNNTIAQNIALNDNAPNIALLKKVCTEVQLLSFIEKLPLNFETRLGFNGINLSDGQKQLILIARALYSKSPIIILDEATNYLDVATERVVLYGLMQNESSNRTVILTTRSIAILKIVPNIIVLKNGTVVQEGNYNSLINEEGEFKRLYS